MSFDIPHAISEANNDSWSSMQIATPIVVGMCVALIAVLLFLWYRRAVSLKLIAPTPFPTFQRNFLSMTPSSRSVSEGPSRWDSYRFAFYRVLPTRFRPMPKSTTRDASWEIDSDWGRPAGGSPSSDPATVHLYAPSEPYFPNPHPRESGEYFPLPDQDRVRTRTPGHSATVSGHDRMRSDGTTRSTAPLLPAISIPSLPRVSLPRPSFLDRFMEFKDGVRKSPSYRMGKVSEVPIPKRFRIDRSRESTVETPTMGHHAAGGAGGVGGAGCGEVLGAGGQRCASPVQEVQEDEESVLLISRRPGVDFVLSDDGSTITG